jgi:hypothetical protein
VFYARDGISPLVKDGKWQPYGENRTLVVKRKRNPVEAPTLLHTVINVPATNVWLGLDMETFKWVKPYGDGLHSDMLLRFNSDPINKYDVNWATMDVSFTNNPYAGAYLMKVDEASDLKTKYTADSNATYKAEFSYVLEQSPGNRRYWNFLDTDSYLVFRTRTRVDKDNNLVGAYYGNIHGPWRSGTEFMFLSGGCFNPVENDVNIEDGTVLRTVLKNMGRGK